MITVKNSLLVLSVLAACGSQLAVAQVPALYGSTSVLQWQQMSALGNTVALGADRITAINAGNYSISSGTGSELQAVTRSKIPIGNVILPVDVVAKIPAASYARAIGNFAMKVAVPVQVGFALWDLANELGYALKNKPDGSLAFTVNVNSNLYSASCGGGQWTTAGPGTIQQVAQQCASNYQNMAGPYYGISGCTVTGFAVDYQTRQADLVSSGTTQANKTVQEFVDDVASRSGWPSSSAIVRAVGQAIQSGESVVVNPQSVTGPSSSPGSTSSTTTSGSPAVAPTPATSSSPATAGKPAVDSITTTKTTTNNYTYSGPNVTVTNSTVTNITNNSTGQVETSTTQKAPELKNADLKPDKVEDPATDTPLSDIPKLYTPVYPRGVEGVWSDAKSAMSGTSLVRLIPSLMPAVGSGGQCPTMPLNLNVAHWANFGTVDVAPPCFLWDFGKVVIIMSALLLARGLVFGG